MIDTPTFLVFPTFSTAGAKVQPDISVYDTGYPAGVVYPTQNHNWLFNRTSSNLNTAEDSIQSLVAENLSILADRGITPDGGVDDQVLTAIKEMLMDPTYIGSGTPSTATFLNGVNEWVEGSTSDDFFIGQTYFNYSGSGAGIDIAQGGSGNRFALIDFHSDETYTTYGLRIIRNSGANSLSTITHRGTNTLQVATEDAGSNIQLIAAGTTILDAKASNSSRAPAIVSYTSQDDAYGILQIQATGASSASLIVKSTSQTAQMMIWSTNGVRVGSRALSGGTGNLYLTHGTDTAVLTITKPSSTYLTTITDDLTITGAALIGGILTIKTKMLMTTPTIVTWLDSDNQGVVFTTLQPYVPISGNSCAVRGWLKQIGFIQYISNIGGTTIRIYYTDPNTAITQYADAVSGSGSGFGAGGCILVC